MAGLRFDVLEGGAETAARGVQRVASVQIVVCQYGKPVDSDYDEDLRCHVPCCRWVDVA